ncbi:MAG: serine hydrolase domain-containing protein [Pacificimonas sp.]
MRLTQALTAALAFGLMSCAPAASAPAPKVAADAPVEVSFTNLRAEAKRLIRDGVVPNVVIGIATPDGRTHWMREGTLGFENAAPADEQSIYRIYSMTKPVTGLAAAILISEGKLGLDQPVAKILPAFADTQVLVDSDTYGEPRVPARPMTIRHLMTHMSGLGYSIIPSAVSEAYVEAGIVPGWRRSNFMRPSAQQPASLQEFASRVAAQPLRVDPGTEWHYSVGLDILGAVIENVSGQSFESYLQDRVFAPLGMDDTDFVVDADDVARLTDNHARADGRTVVFDAAATSEYLIAAPFPAGGAGLAGTGEDYLRFLAAMTKDGMIDGKQALPAEAVRLATSNLIPDNGRVTGFEWKDTGFGAGARVLVDPAASEPLGTYGWGGAASTMAAAMPEQDVAYVIMTQIMVTGDHDMRSGLRRALGADLAAIGLIEDRQTGN